MDDSRTLDGLRAAAAIRKKEQLTGEHVTIIALTAHAMSENPTQCLAAGMDGYVSKPIKIDELIKETNRLAITASNEKHLDSLEQVST